MILGARLRTVCLVTDGTGWPLVCHCETVAFLVSSFLKDALPCPSCGLDDVDEKVICSLVITASNKTWQEPWLRQLIYLIVFVYGVDKSRD